MIANIAKNVLIGLVLVPSAACWADDLRERRHPLVTVRLNATSRPDDYKKIVEINRRNSGSADEYWFGRGGAGPRLEILKARWRKQAEMKKVCEAAGIACGFQQGVTLGHGSIYDPAGGGQAKADLHPFTDDAWQVDKDGKRMLMFCPRSPEVLRYEEEYAAALGETLKPVSLWLDDDLRLGFCKPDGCFCANCLAAFGAKFGQTLSREELVKRLFGPAKKDSVRRAWLDFLSESLALYGAAARRGMNRTNPNCLVAYQSVDPMTLATGRDYASLLRDLSDGGKYPTSIRIGSGCYGEDLRDLTYKMQGVAFEAERIRRSGLNLSAVSYEQETYRREALHKTPEAIAVESALAMACGCDAVTEYYWDEKRAEPLSYYAEFAETMSAWRPYFERLAAVSRRTSLGGVARFIGRDFDLIAKRTLRSATDLDLAGVGVPVTAMASGAKIRYVNADSLSEWGEGDAARLLADGAVALVDAPCVSNFFGLGGVAVKTAVAEGRVRTFDIASGVVRLGHTFAGHYPTHAERASLLDAFDALHGAKLPVRVERAHPVFVYPRVDGAGRVVAVTFYNGAAGAMLPTVVKIRRPVAKYPVWTRPCVSDQPLYVAASTDEELTVVLPELPARQVGTLFLEEKCPETACEKVSIKGEKAFLPPYDAKRAGWLVGYRLNASRMWEVAASDAVLPDSVRVVAADGRPLKRDVDYRLEPRYGALGLVGAAISNATVNPVSIDYVCRTERLDAWYRDEDGLIGCVRSESAVTRPKPPQLPTGAKLLGHFWIRGGGRADDGRYFRNDGQFVWPHPLVSASKAMPKTLAKLRAGEPVTILAWGDNVTECGYLHPSERWQAQLLAALRTKFPKSKINLVSEAWGGRNTGSYLGEPSGSKHNFAEKVLAVKPDLVISEFVNDGGMKAADVESRYGRILSDFRKRGIEWVAFTPHYIIPDWMGMRGTSECDEDPREYVRALKAFAIKNAIGVADASARWGHLWREGLPYTIYFANGVNHPDAEGMGFFVEAFLSFLDAPDVLTTEDVDRLCPPRPETAAKFAPGAYPPAASPYREAALAIYEYMTGLPAMTALVETGKPNQKYQHNAYVSKTHAAHIGAMLNWAKVAPGKREKALRFAKASAEFLLGELEPADAPLAGWPPTYGRKPLEFDPKTDGPYLKPAMVGNEPIGAVRCRGEVMLVYPSSVGTAFVDYYEATKDARFLAAAKRIGETYLKTRRVDGSWPLKMRLATGEAIGGNTLVPTSVLGFFEKLFAATGDRKWRAAADEAFAWIESHPLNDWNWDGQFEDIPPCRPYLNPTKHNACDTLMYMLRRFPDDSKRRQLCRRLLDFSEKRFVVWKTPENRPGWPAPSVLEQYSCFTPIDSSASKLIRAYVAMYRAEGRAEDLQKARALADSITREQLPSGRVPTFWDKKSFVHDERYDWLNCMASSAQALLLVDEVR